MASDQTPVFMLVLVRSWLTSKLTWPSVKIEDPSTQWQGVLQAPDDCTLISEQLFMVTSNAFETMATYAKTCLNGDAYFAHSATTMAFAEVRSTIFLLKFMTQYPSTHMR
jgi:hypothetical protein